MDKIDLRVVTAFALRARTDDEKDSVAVGAIHKMMAVRDPGLEACGVARPHDRLSFIIDQYQLALNHINKLVFLLVPMSRRRCCAGPQPHEVDAELRQTRHLTERLPFPAIDDSGERFRIRRSAAHRQRAQVDLRHQPLFSSPFAFLRWLLRRVDKGAHSRRATLFYPIVSWWARFALTTLRSPRLF